MLTAIDPTQFVSSSTAQRQDPGRITRGASTPGEGTILGESEAMQHLRMQVRLLGPHFRIVLLHGEPGTGKELTARTIHQHSSHANGPFVGFECDGNEGTPKGLIDALQAAHRGTVYLRNVEAMRRNTQAVLLAVLQGRDRVLPNPIVVHGLEGRIIASATEDLRVAVASGRFLHDLYRRISAVAIELPPLRKRREDIPALARHFLDSLGMHEDVARGRLTEHCLARWMDYKWPGNIEELKQNLSHVVQAIHMKEAGPVRMRETEVHHEEVPAAGGVLRLQEVLDQHVLRILRECSGNKVRTAEALGISRSTLYRMLEAGLPEDKLAKLR